MSCRTLGLSQLARRLVVSACTLVACLVTVHVARACDTPVYRYAMYRWFPSPYEVYYFYNDKMQPEAETVKAELDKYRDPVGAPAHVVFLPVDLKEDKDLTSIPPDIKDTWLKKKKPPVPSYLISSPGGVEVFSGQVSKQDLDALVDSPVRQQMGAQLKQGKAGLFLLLSGKDAKATQQAETLLKSVVADVASGKVPLYGLMGDEPEPTDGSAEGEAKPPRLEIGLVKLARDAPEETWLIRMLLAVEPDLNTVDDPIVFVIYGRGRTLFSCLGKGSDRDNLLMDVEFITGACSCTVKDQNPGVDLLMRYDWDAVASELAGAFGPEEGNSFAGGEESLFPELIIPAAGNMPDDTDDSGEKEPSDTVIAQAGSIDSAGDTSASGSPESARPSTTAEQQSPPAVDHAENKAPQQTASVPAAASARNPAGTKGESREKTGFLWIVLGLVAGLGVLFAATFLVLRPR